MAAALGATFAPFCEVVVHDLTRPKHSIVTLHNPLSGRQVGDPATDHGQRRISDPTYPQRGLRFAVMGLEVAGLSCHCAVDARFGEPFATYELNSRFGQNPGICGGRSSGCSHGPENDA